MAWFLIVVLAVVAVLALLAVLALAAFVSDEAAEAERARIEMEVRRAERRLHDLASSSFRTMLHAARSEDRR